MNFFRDDPRLSWEFMKFKIKEFTKKYSSEKKKKDVVERRDLERKLKNLSDILIQIVPMKQKKNTRIVKVD